MSLRWLGIVILCAGCSGFGRAVVGEHGSGFGMQACQPALPCEPLALFEPESVPESAMAIDLTQCDLTAGTLCTGSATMPLGQCAAPAGSERTFEEIADLGQLSCSALLLKHAGTQVLARIEIAAWNQVHVAVESEQPATLELVGGHLEHVSLTLRGPITLRVLENEQIRDLRVSSDGAARIELTGTQAASVSIAAPQAEVQLRRSAIDQLRVSAQRLDLESSFVSDAAWQAEWLNAVDATLLRVHSQVARSVLSACDTSMSRFSSCQSWTSVQGHFNDVQLPACAGELSVYGSAIVRGQLEGDLLLDGAILSSVVLGLGQLGSITSWDTQLSDVTFCADRHVLSLGGDSGVSCAHCDLAPGPVTPDACAAESSQARVVDSDSCEVLRSPPACGDPQPERMRPPRM